MLGFLEQKLIHDNGVIASRQADAVFVFLWTLHERNDS